MVGLLVDLLANLWAGIRNALILPVRRDDVRDDLHQIAVLVVVQALTMALLDLALHWPVQGVDPMGVAYWLARFALIFIAAYVTILVAWAERGGDAFLILMLAGWTVLSLVFTAAHAFAFELVPLPPEQVQVVLIVLQWTWLLLIGWRAARITLRTDVSKSFWLAAVFWGIAIGPTYYIPQASVFPAAGDPYATLAKVEVDIERLYTAQPDLLQQRLALLQPQTPGRVDLYAVGFAGYAHEKVFRREVEAVADLMSQRFGAGGRFLRLVNDAAAPYDHPLANRTNLSAALDYIGARMDPVEDVLFLFITSHGHDKLISTQFGPLGLNPLFPEDIRSALDKAGIRNRVIVLSACHAGSFARSLSGPRTLVISAAAADKNSFGCADNREWTYFGKALFDQALRQTFSFEEAFLNAREIVSQWEQEQGFEPSEPQIFMGGEIRDVLQRFEAERAVAWERLQAAAVRDALDAQERAAGGPFIPR